MSFTDLLQPITQTEPCGPNLEYDPEYSVLFAKIANRSDVQYGDFIEEPEAINWSEIERECRRLLLRTKDIALLILLTRCRTRLSGATGFYECLALLLELIKKYPDQLNPQLEIDGEIDVAVRANALAMLIDSEGLLGDLREVVLSKNTGTRLQIRDIERAFSIPHPLDALAPESVLSQLQEMIFNDNQEVLSIIRVLPVVDELLNWAKNNLRDFSPDFSPLNKLLALFKHPDIQPHIVGELYGTEQQINEQIVTTTNETLPFVESINTDGENQMMAQNTRNNFSQDSRVGRKQALEAVKNARLWFEQYEPSSPVIVLLKQAERMVGKRFSDLVQTIPYDLLMTWDGVEQAEQEGDFKKEDES